MQYYGLGIMNARRPNPNVLLGGLLLSLVVILGSTVHSGTQSVEPVRASSTQCVEDPLGDLFEPMLTPLKHPPKRDKVPAVNSLSAKRPGFHRVVTTLFSVHSKEAVPVLKGLKPPDDVLDHLFRCRGFGDSHHVDDRLFAMIVKAADQFKSQRVEIISAYRSIKFNEALSKKGRRVAVESRHTRGEAIDFRLTNVSARRVGQWLRKYFDGGVGTYSRDNFIHIDMGPKRRWYGR
jgi:hypothetical protein